MYFPNNQDVLNLIDNKSSWILPALDDICLLRKGTNEASLNALYRKCDTHDQFNFTTKQKTEMISSINHYAGHILGEGNLKK